MVKPKSPFFLPCLLICSLLLFNCDRENQAASSDLANDPASQQIQVYGHRGASAFYAENSLTSVKAALAQVQGAEIDIQLTRDLVPIVLHDDTFERTAASLPENSKVDPRLLQTPVSELNWNEIKGIAIAPRGEKVPSLVEILDELSQYPDKKLLVEIKSYGAEDRSIQEKMVASLDRTFKDLKPEIRQQVIFISFDDEVLQQLDQSSHLKGIDRYWLLSGDQIEAAAAKGELPSLLQRGRSFTGLDIESGPYLYRISYEGKDIVKLIKDQKQKVITWISRRQRTDGRHWLKISNALGVDIFTSDLPIDVVYQDRWKKRLDQTIQVLRNHKLDARLIDSTVENQSGDLMMNQVKFNLYVPTSFDYQGLEMDDLRRAIEADLRFLSDRESHIMINLSDLMEDEKANFLSQIKVIDPQIQGRILIIEPTFTQNRSLSPVIDVDTAKARLSFTNDIGEYTIFNGKGVTLCRSSNP